MINSEAILLLILFVVNIIAENGVDIRVKRNVVHGPIRLINEPACREIRNLCSKLSDDANDLEVLKCVQTFLTSQIESLSDECQHSIWSHTSELLEDDNVAKLTQKLCANDLPKLGCKANNEPGHLLACLLDHHNDIKSAGCRNVIQELELVAFSDFRLIGPFVRDCEDDIEANGCGRLSTDRNTLSQGETLACLQSKIDDLTKECRKGVLRLSELQSDNVRLDKKLFLACTADAQRFCPDIRPGTGAVYKCLIRNKNDQTMSSLCKEQLLRRDKLIAHDYKVSKGLARACKEDIKNNKCRRGVSEDKDVRLAQILLCLEAASKNNTKISPECLAEMTDHRKLLMDDFQLSPEILTGCADDITKFCDSLEAAGKTIHCLMEHARPKKKKDRRITSTCQRALEMVIKVSDVAEDWRVDPVLRNACKPVVDIACRDASSGDARVMSCLMEKIGTEFMTSDCEIALMQIQYFVARDFKLDPQLYRNCKADAIKLCHAKPSWDNADNAPMDPDRGPLILPCLYRSAFHPDKDVQLKPECFQEIKRVMRQRAISVDLIPEVEDMCIDDLANYCFDKTQKGEEMQCLQDNLEKLIQKCKTAVITYTEEEAAHIELNPVIMSHCRNEMERHCDSILKSGRDEGDMMECLIAHKNDPDFRQNIKCRAVIEHFQITSLKNYHFTYKFKEACRPHVMRFCPNSNTKYDVVECLSEVMRNDTLKGQRHTIPKECRQQVRAQLYQQRENIDFDPKLKSACKEDIKKFCLNVPNGAGQVLECLQNQHDQLGPTCRHAIFAIRKSELTDSSTDYTLLNSCAAMIRQYCHDTETSKSLECLKIHKDEPLFDGVCKLVVVNRMIEQNMDYRFNPMLQSACSKNIAEYCTNIVASAKQDEELNGKVVGCLKTKFREGKLTKKCEEQMTEVLHEQALNYKLNPLLKSVCKPEISYLCNPKDGVEEYGEVEECLKLAFLNHKIISHECKFEVATLIQEAKADIHVDPLLQRACTVDLLKYCSNVPSGNGRLLKCLQVILADESKALEPDCKSKLEKRMEMFRNAAPLIAHAPEDLGQLYAQVATSPARRYFIVLGFSAVGFTFIFGMFFGRLFRRQGISKNK